MPCSRYYQVHFIIGYDEVLSGLAPKRHILAKKRHVLAQRGPKNAIPTPFMLEVPFKNK